MDSGLVGAGFSARAGFSDCRFAGSLKFWKMSPMKTAVKSFVVGTSLAN